MKRYRKPYRIKKKKPIWKNRFFWLGILSLIILGGIFYFFLFSDFFQVEKVIVTTEERVSAEDIKSIVENELEENLLFFKTKSIFLVNLNKIEEKILAKLPQIGEITINKRLPDALNLVVVERKEVGIFCQNDLCFLLDGEGVIFEKASEELQLLKIRKSVLKEELKLGERVIKKEQVSKILEIETKLKENLKIPIEEVLIVSDERFNIKTIEGWEIYFNPQKDLNWQLTKLKAVLEEEIPPERRKDLDYIELRFGNLAPYKYR